MNLRLSRATIPAAAVVAGAAMLLFAPFTRASDALLPGHGPLPAWADPLSLKLEAGVALPLTEPQSQRFKLGGSGTLKALWSLTEYLDVGPSATFVALPSESSEGGSGRAWAWGASVQVKRPHTAPDDDRFHAISPWADADLLYVRSGPLNRAGFAVAAGLAIPIGAARQLWIGPFVRYFQVLQQPERTGFDNRDAKLLSIGVSVELGSGVKPRTVAFNTLKDRSM
jgi:hypothetical protein